jgi:hypothetical protein
MYEVSKSFGEPSKHTKARLCGVVWLRPQCGGCSRCGVVFVRHTVLKPFRATKFRPKPKGGAPANLNLGTNIVWMQRQHHCDIMMASVVRDLKRIE